MKRDELIRVLYPTIPTRYLAEYLGMKVFQIYNRVYIWNVKKNPRILKMQNRKLRIESSKKNQFVKGHIPHNKGKKMSAELRSKIENTMFKKGHKPPNTKEQNAISIRIDTKGRPYYYSKIKDSVWVLSHRLIWEQNFGQIPKNHIVRFKDGNTMNLKIENLECISKNENAIRNSIQRFPKDLQKVIRLKSKLNKKIKNHGKKRNE